MGQAQQDKARAKEMNQIADAHMIMDKMKQEDTKNKKLLNWANGGKVNCRAP